MRNYRNVLAALVFVFVLSVPTFGDDGVIHTGNPDPSPTPPAASTTQDTASDGIMQGGSPAPAPAPQPTDDLTGIALGLLQTMTLI